MKKLVKILALMCLSLGVALAMCACGEEETPSGSSSVPSAGSSTVDNSTTDSSNTDSSNTDNGENDEPQMVDYTVKAIDPFGNELEVSVIVEMFKDGVSLGEMPIRKGSAIFRQEAGDYTFTLAPMEGQFYYDQSECTFSSEVTEKTITLYDYADDTQTQEIWVYDENTLDHIPCDAVQVSEGGVYVSISRPECTYFIFTPTRGGIYRVSYESSKAVTLGYYGSPHNVLRDCPIDVVDGAFEIEVKNEGVSIGNPGGTTQLVIGIRSYVVKNCVLKIERVGDATVDLPWTDIQADKNAIKVDNYINSEFVDFDVTNGDLSAVYNENDGYYHLNTADGPIIYVRITNALIKSQTEEETVYAFLPSFIAMCETDRLGRVFYDEDGNITLKESYNEMFKAYAELCGTKGMYPLNEQLANAIKNTGAHKGWFNLDGDIHIFGDNASQVVSENAWLFACAYENEKALGNSEKPAPVAVNKADSPVSYAVLADKNEEIVLRTVASATLTINNAEGVKVITSDGTEYVADSETGVLSCVINGTQNFKIVYCGDSEQTVIRFTFIEYFS